mgnify:CR=1 FL=1
MKIVIRVTDPEIKKIDIEKLNELQDAIQGCFEEKVKVFFESVEDCTLYA